jgi:hypothetical protein
MNTLKRVCEKAASNLEDEIHSDRRFPQNVFSANWCEFLFFDSDWMFDSAFIERVKALLDLERANCACLRNLDAAANDKRSQSQFFINRTTTESEYQSLLKGSGPGLGWIHDIERFACSSEISQWCIYCERNNEMAVIAFRQESSAMRYMPIIKSFKAARLAEALAQPLAFGFSAQSASEAWRRDLQNEYACRRK